MCGNISINNMALFEVFQPLSTHSVRGCAKFINDDFEKKKLASMWNLSKLSCVSEMLASPGVVT